MKKLLSFALVLVMLCSSFAFTANMDEATIDGIEFEANSIYKVENDLDAEPITIEAMLYINKRLRSGSAKGVIFGNEKGIANAPCMSLKITSAGVPQLYVKGYKWTEDNTGEAYTCTFENAAVIRSEWVHLAVVRDLKKEEVRCYVNGELTDTVSARDVGPMGLYDFAVGGDRTSHNTNYLQNAKLRSLSVYSDMRTEAEIKKDMEALDKSGLILHYDFSALTEKNPAILTDLSGSKNNANYNRIFFDEKEPVTDYAYSFAVIGDTQKVALYYPENFNKIYEYVYDNIESKNIEMVIGLGDITDTNSGDNTEYEWQVALEGMKIIDDYVPHIPIRGNHDSIFWYNKVIAQTNYAGIIDGKFSENDYRNTYVDFSVGGIPYLFLNLDFDMKQEELEWACKVVEQFPNHNVIVSRHGHMNHDYTPLTRGEALNPGLPRISGDELWEGLLSKYENIVLCLSGHIGSELVVTTQREGVNGNTVTEMLLDFQDCDVTATNAGYTDGGLGTVNMFYFSEDGSKLTVETYATINGKYFHDHNQFTIELDMVTDTKYVKGEKKDVPPRVEEKATEIKMTVDSMTAYVNGTATTLDAAPVIKNSRTMLPVRFVAENLGATVGWDAATQTVSITSATTTIEIVIGANTAKINGADVALDSPAYIDVTNNRTYLPVRVVAENLGATVAWDDATKTAILAK